MSLAKIVRALLASGLTEQQLADLVGTSQSSIHRIKKGVIDPERPSRVRHVGPALRALHKKRLEGKSPVSLWNTPLNLTK